tara:strand:+ start:65 stop:583 length:519 start_codon:yes stop_codon:yes gene_type:complete
MAYNAFDAMNQSAGGDMHITGGAIGLSEYENNMTPDDQSKYEKLLMDRFQMAYNRDPYKQNLDFKHWLQTLNPDLYRERAQRYDDIKAENYGLDKLRTMDQLEGALLEDAGLLQSLAHLHTGRIEDLIEIVETMEPGMSPAQGQLPFRRPQESVPPMQDESLYEGGGDQGPF